MAYFVSNIVAAAKALVNDQHVDNEDWIDVGQWVTWFNWEYLVLYKELVQKSLIVPQFTDQAFTGYTTNVNRPLAIVGVAENLGSYMRPLRPAQSVGGHYPFWVASSAPGGKSISWMGTEDGLDNIVIELNPRDASGSYVVRSVPLPNLSLGISDTFSLPPGCDRLLAMRMATYALIVESAASAALERKIKDAREEIGLTFGGRIHGDGPRVRRVRSNNQRFMTLGQMNNGFIHDPAGWYFV